MGAAVDSPRHSAGYCEARPRERRRKLPRGNLPVDRAVARADYRNARRGEVAVADDVEADGRVWNFAQQGGVAGVVEMDIPCADGVHAGADFFDVDFVAVCDYRVCGLFADFLDLHKLAFGRRKRGLRRAEIFEQPHCRYRPDFGNRAKFYIVFIIFVHFFELWGKCCLFKANNSENVAGGSKGLRGTLFGRRREGRNRRIFRRG